MQSQSTLGNIKAGSSQHLQKLYNTNKASLKAAHWVINPETGTYDVETIRQGRRRPEIIPPGRIGMPRLQFWKDQRNASPSRSKSPKPEAKEHVVCRKDPITCSPSR
ncbi:hypothetical protein Tco_0883633 [Tanacetum coccineum]